MTRNTVKCYKNAAVDYDVEYVIDDIFSDHMRFDRI